jgi:phosphopantothenoylcysteine decarboxylase/phosphopantothenate--cysteine ligase
VQTGKIKKDQVGQTLTLELVRNPDILSGLAASRRQGQIIIGFAAETEEDADALIAVGREKIRRKGCDYLVLNRVGWTTGFTTDDNAVVVLDVRGAIVKDASGTKMSVANSILDVIAHTTISD